VVEVVADDESANPQCGGGAGDGRKGDQRRQLVGKGAFDEVVAEKEDREARILGSAGGVEQLLDVLSVLGDDTEAKRSHMA